MKTKKIIGYTKSNNTIRNKSYSPLVNKYLDVTSLKSIRPNELNLCNSLLKINIGSKSKPNCLEYHNNKVIKYMLRNLQSNKHLDPRKFIAPKQLLANCWFNTMFVSFFFSDKGRKFFRFFRILMITGKKYNKKDIDDKELRKLFFILNLFIEASYNQFKNNNFTKNKKTKRKKTKSKKTKSKKTKSKRYKKNVSITLFDQINFLTNNLNTNYFIKKIYDKINVSIYKSIPNINDAGNPLEYYKTIMKYLNYDILKLMKIEFSNNENTYKILNSNFLNHKITPDIIILEDHESGTKFDKLYEFIKNNKKYKYVLDSIILTNKQHYNPKENSHFVSVLTINNEEYKFDGDSYSRLSKFKWKKMINKNKDWTFQENHNYYPEKYNFTRGYKIMFYYRV